MVFWPFSWYSTSNSSRFAVDRRKILYFSRPGNINECIRRGHFFFCLFAWFFVLRRHLANFGHQIIIHNINIPMSKNTIILGFNLNNLLNCTNHINKIKKNICNSFLSKMRRFSSAPQDIKNFIHNTYQTYHKIPSN